MPESSCFNWVTFAPNLKTTPRLAYSARSNEAISRSMPFSISSIISITVTFTPKSQKNEANSMPITPPPTITSDWGSALLSSASRCVQYATLSMPGIGGITVRLPVQSIRCSHSYVSSPQRTVFLSTIDASPFTNVTCAAFSFALMPSTNLRTTFALRAIIFGKSQVIASALTLYLRAFMHIYESFDAYRSVFVGMHPSLRHTPPTLFFSNKTTLNPALPASSAAVYPAGPPPIIATWYFMVFFYIRLLYSSAYSIIGFASFMLAMKAFRSFGSRVTCPLVWRNTICWLFHAFLR